MLSSDVFFTLLTEYRSNEKQPLFILVIYVECSANHLQYRTIVLSRQIVISLTFVSSYLCTEKSVTVEAFRRRLMLSTCGPGPRPGSATDVSLPVRKNRKTILSAGLKDKKAIGQPVGIPTTAQVMHRPTTIAARDSQSHVMLNSQQIKLPLFRCTQRMIFCNRALNHNSFIIVSKAKLAYVSSFNIASVFSLTVYNLDEDNEAVRLSLVFRLLRILTEEYTRIILNTLTAHEYITLFSRDFIFSIGARMSW